MNRSRSLPRIAVWAALSTPALLAQGAGGPPPKQMPNEFSFNHFAGADTSKLFKKLFVAERSHARINWAYEYAPDTFATSFEGQGTDSFAVLKGVRTVGPDWQITVGYRIGSFDGLVENGTHWGLERDVWENNDPKKGELQDFFYLGMTYLGGNLRCFANKNGSTVGSVVTLNGTTEGYLRLHQMGTTLEAHAWAPGGQPQLVYTESAPQPWWSNYSFGAARLGGGTHILCLGADAQGDVNGEVETPAIEAVKDLHTDLSALDTELGGVAPDVPRIRNDLVELGEDVDEVRDQLPSSKTDGVQKTTQGNTAKRQLQLARRKIDDANELLALGDIEGARALLQSALIDFELAKGALKGIVIKKPEQRSALQNNGF